MRADMGVLPGSACFLLWGRQEDCIYVDISDTSSDHVSLVGLNQVFPLPVRPSGYPCYEGNLGLPISI